MRQRNVMPEPSDFIFVTRGRRRNKKRNFRSITHNTNSDEEQDSDLKIDQDYLLRTINNVLIEVSDTSFTKFVLSRLRESLTVLNFIGISEILCYGLGRFSQYRSPRYQLALLLYLKARYNARVYVYDPVFCPEEVQVLRTLGLEVIEINEEGKRVIRDKTTTLVYMPHCSRQLTNNFLYANWGDRLNNCILLNNSFSQISDNYFHTHILDAANYIRRIQPYVTEIQLVNSFVHDEVFNDLNIHIFKKQDLLKVPSDFWNSREEPQYFTNEIES